MYRANYLVDNPSAGSLRGGWGGGGGGSAGASLRAHEFKGTTSQTRESARVFLEQGKQNKMCAFVNI